MMNYLFLAVTVTATINENRYFTVTSFEIIKIQFKVSKVVDCGLKRIGDLNYDFYLGACETFRFPEERILLCFSDAHKSKCER